MEVALYRDVIFSINVDYAFLRVLSFCEVRVIERQRIGIRIVACRTVAQNILTVIGCYRGLSDNNLIYRCP